MSDAELIERVAARDPDAFAELHRRVVRASFGLALRATDDREEAEAAAAGASAAIRSAAPRFAGEDPDRWLYGVVRAAVGASDADADAYGPSWRAYRAVALLPEPERQVVELASWGRMTTAEIASFLNLPERGVEELSAAGLARLRAELGAHAGGDPLGGVSPPPDIPPELAVPPGPSRSGFVPTPRRYRSTALIGAVIVGLVLFGAGYVVGSGGSRQERSTVELAGTRIAPLARGELVVYRSDEAGNTPLELTVTGLPSDRDATYELWVTTSDGGPLGLSAGTFHAAGRETSVTLNLPRAPEPAAGWAVLRARTSTRLLESTTP